MGLVQCTVVASAWALYNALLCLRLGIVQCSLGLGASAWALCNASWRLRLGLVQCKMVPPLGPCATLLCACASALYKLWPRGRERQRQAKKASRKAKAVPGYSRANSKTCWRLPLLTAAELHASLLLGLLPSCGNPAILVCSLFPFIKAIAGLTVLEAAHLTAAADAFRPWVLGQSRLPCRLCFPW